MEIVTSSKQSKSFLGSVFVDNVEMVKILLHINKEENDDDERNKKRVPIQRIYIMNH